MGREKSKWRTADKVVEFDKRRHLEENREWNYGVAVRMKKYRRVFEDGTTNGWMV